MLNPVLLGKEHTFFIFFSTNSLSGMLMSLTEIMTNSSRLPIRLATFSAHYCTSAPQVCLSPNIHELLCYRTASIWLRSRQCFNNWFHKLYIKYSHGLLCKYCNYFAKICIDFKSTDFIFPKYIVAITTKNQHCMNITLNNKLPRISLVLISLR